MAYAPPPPPRRSIYDVRRPLEMRRPDGPAALIAVGSVFVMIEGIVEIAIGAYIAGNPLAAQGSAVLVGGLILATLGLLLFGLGLVVHAEPHHHVANGALALVLVFLTFLFGTGGFVLGGLLAGIGGLWAIYWKP